MNKCWQLTPERLSQDLSTDCSTGLTEAEAKKRIGEYGHNKLIKKGGVGPWEILLGQFKDFMIWVLIGAALISGIIGEMVDTIAIIGIVALNALLGFIQEYRAEKSLAALRKLTTPIAKVLRDGQLRSIPSEDLVPGDIIALDSGDNIPADSRLISVTANFSTQEASLTGESVPVAKHCSAITGDVAIADRINMVFMGTTVVSGRAQAMIVHTGMSTELGRIAGLIQEIRPEPTPLQKKLAVFGQLLVKICFVLVVFVFLLQWLHGGKLADVFLTAVSLAVAAIPEGLPAVVTIALALGVQRMVRRHALIRKLPSVETLGCATVICSDKTGTLTKNEMTVRAIYAGGNLFQVSGSGYAPQGDISLSQMVIDPNKFSELRSCLLCGTLCNGAQLIVEGSAARIVGDPTEGAILSCAGKAGLWQNELAKEHEYVQEIPFDSARKMMSMIRKESSSGLVAYVKGAPDVLLGHCTSMLSDNQCLPITADLREQILRVNSNLAHEAMRVLAVAYRQLPSSFSKYEAAEVENDLCFVGLIAMIDPPRPEAIQAVRQCQSAGINAVMITGDHLETAVAIGTELGIHKENQLALTGNQLNKINDSDFDKEVENVSVYARVAPEDKLRIVRAWKKQGQIVAMTGDGVNDAPAIKEADIGVAMGITGTDVTKEVSDLIITDDNFASIVAAVEEGRGIYDNILKFIHYLLSCNAGEILVMLVASLCNMPVPLLPIHILWVNLVTDGLPALALGMDPIDTDVMKRPPRDPKEPVVSWRSGMTMIMQGSFIALCTLVAYVAVYYWEGEGIVRARTAAFIVLSCSQLFHSLNCRSATKSIFSLGLFSNTKLVWAILISLALQIGAVSTPFLQTVFKTTSLSVLDWCIVLLLSSLPLWAMETVKRLRS